MKLKNKQSGAVHIVAILLVIVIAVVGVVGWKVWDSGQSNETTSNTSPTKVNDETKTNDKADTTKKAASSDEQVLAAIKAYCNAYVDPVTKQAFVLKVGTLGPAQKTILYSSDNNFASLNAVCSKDGTTEGSGSGYLFKKVNESWVFLCRGQMEDAECIANFNVPKDFN